MLRADGWLADVCERWIPNAVAGRRHDLFGILDIVAVRAAETMGVQTTSHTNFHARTIKLSDDEHRPSLLALRAAGWTIAVHGWRLTDRNGHACKHRPAACACRWVLHHHAVLTEDTGEQLKLF